MFTWKIFKYPFGRFCCWHIFLFSGATGIASLLISAVNWHYTKTLKDAGIALKSADKLSNLLSNSEYIAEHFTAFDTTLVLLAISILIIGFYYSIILATKRMLFYPYNYIGLIVSFNKIPLKHIVFILLGFFLSDYFPIFLKETINGYLPQTLVNNDTSFAFFKECLLIFLSLISMYFVLQFYLGKNANIEWLQNTTNKES